jgi:hypothetical protein
MKQRRRVYGRAKVDYQRMIRDDRKAAGLTILGTVPKRLLAQKWQAFRNTMNVQAPRLLQPLERKREAA